MKKVHTFNLPNGVTVIHSERADVSSVALNIQIMAGSMYEDDSEVGVAHFLEHIVFDGTKKYGDEKVLSEVIEKRGGLRGGSTTKEIVEYSVKVLKEDVESAFDYISEMVSAPLIKEKDIVKEKKVIEQEIYRFQDSAEMMSERYIYSGLFPGTRLGGLNTGDVTDVSKIKRENILEYMRKHYIGDNIVLSVSGNVSKKEVEDLAHKYFMLIGSGERNAMINIDAQSDPKPIIVSKPGLKQSGLRVAFQAFRADEEEHAALGIILQILARGKSSRLIQNIREKSGLAYQVNGRMYAGRNYGMCSFYCGVSNENIEKCRTLLMDELSIISREAIGNEEAEKVLNYNKASYLFSFEDTEKEAAFYGHQWCYKGRVVDIGEEISRLERVSKDLEYMKSVARKTFQEKSPVTFIVSTAK